MKLKTFLATFLLFLVVLFASLSVVSVYMTRNQMGMLKDKSAAEYQMMATSFSKDIVALVEREGKKDYGDDINTLVNGYAEYYKKYNINIFLSDTEILEKEDKSTPGIELSFVDRGKECYIYVTGPLAEPFENYQLDYYYDVTKSVTDMRNIQNILLVVGIIFSAITAFFLHLILSGIFKPMNIVTKISKKIADGHYNERIQIKGKNEVALMAANFNRMAEEIEIQIKLLENEAAQKQQFVDNFAHEIRTPLTSIYGYAEYLQRAAHNEAEVIESTQYIIEEADHMKKLANSLLELATLRHYKLMQSNVSVPQLFEFTKQAMKNILEERKIELICNYSIDILRGQEDLIKSLLLNLCTNAAKACPVDKGIIKLNAYKEENKTILSVADNGHGISEENISKVTEAFYRVDKVRSREEGGAGLGLAICKQIAAVHNAALCVESSLNSGTIIKIIFISS